MCMCRLNNSESGPSSTLSLYHPNQETTINTPINKLPSLNNQRLNNPTKEIKRMPTGSSSFESLLLKEINLVRSDPVAYANKLSKMLDYIIESRGVFYFTYPQSDPIILKTGKTIFYQTIEYLKTLKPIPELLWNEELKVDINDENKPLTEEKIGKLLVTKRLQIKDLYNKCIFSFDFMTNPILSVLFQLTDEPFGQKRRDAILNASFQDFAVSFTFDSMRKFVSLLSFA